MVVTCNVTVILVLVVRAVVEVLRLAEAVVRALVVVVVVVKGRHGAPPFLKEAFLPDPRKILDTKKVRKN